MKISRSLKKKKILTNQRDEIHRDHPKKRLFLPIFAYWLHDHLFDKMGRRTAKQSVADDTNVISKESSKNPPEEGSGGGVRVGGYLKSCFNLSTLSTFLACFYLYSTITSMRSLIYPFEGIEVGLDSLDYICCLLLLFFFFLSKVILH